MNKYEAINAMREGKKVTHRFFVDGEYITMDGNFIVDEAGNKFSQLDFWKDRIQEAWENDWEIVQEKNPAKGVDIITSVHKPNKVWIKFVKHFQGGSKDDYMLVNPEDIDTPDKCETLMEYWGAQSEGGHYHGYRVDMFQLDENELPPMEWIEKKLASNEREIGYLLKKIDNIKALDIELLKAKIRQI